MTTEEAPELCRTCNCAGDSGFVLRKELTGATDFWFNPDPCLTHWNKAVERTGATGPIESTSVFAR